MNLKNSGKVVQNKLRIEDKTIRFKRPRWPAERHMSGCHPAQLKNVRARGAHKKREQIMITFEIMKSLKIKKTTAFID